VVAFYFKSVGARAVFLAAILAEVLVITVFVLDKIGVLNVAYLWLNLIGCLLVVVLAFLFRGMDRE